MLPGIVSEAGSSGRTRLSLDVGPLGKASRQPWVILDHRTISHYSRHWSARLLVPALDLGLMAGAVIVATRWIIAPAGLTLGQTREALSDFAAGRGAGCAGTEQPSC